MKCFFSLQNSLKTNFKILKSKIVEKEKKQIVDVAVQLRLITLLLHKQNQQHIFVLKVCIKLMVTT